MTEKDPRIGNVVRLVNKVRNHVDSALESASASSNRREFDKVDYWLIRSIRSIKMARRELKRAERLAAELLDEGLKEEELNLPK